MQGDSYSTKARLANFHESEKHHNPLYYVQMQSAFLVPFLVQTQQHEHLSNKLTPASYKKEHLVSTVRKREIGHL